MSDKADTNWVHAYGGGGASDHAAAIEMEQRLESKAGVLLSHVSIMIAVTGLLYTFAEGSRFVVTLLGIDLLAYLVLAVACIWVQSDLPRAKYESASKSDNERAPGSLPPQERKLYDLVLRKEWVLRATQKCLYAFTALLFFIVAYEVICAS